MGEKKKWKWNLVPTRDTCQAVPARGEAGARQAAPRAAGGPAPPERPIKCSSRTRSRQKQCKQVTDTGLFVRTAAKVRRGERSPRGLRTVPRGSGAPAPRGTGPRRGSAAPAAAPPPGSAGSTCCPAHGWWGTW